MLFILSYFIFRGYVYGYSIARYGFGGDCGVDSGFGYVRIVVGVVGGLAFVVRR